MTTNEIISLSSTAISFLSFVGAIYFARKAEQASRKAMDSEKRANDIAIGQSETALREAISNTRQRMQEAIYKIEEVLQGRDISNLNTAENNRLTLLKQSLSSATEDLLNAYENACGKYIDDKIDKNRFKKSFVNEISNLCKSDVETYAKHMHPEGTSKYEAIWKVYREWHRHEK